MKQLINSCCLNWKAVAGLAVIGLGAWAVAPGAIAAVVPFLIVAVCPLSMVFMMRNMGRTHSAARPACASQRPRAGVTRADTYATLQDELAVVEAEHAAIAGEIARQEAPRVSAVREAEAVVRARQTCV